MTIIKDPLYRYYNCNIQAPHLKSGTIHADVLASVSLPNGISTLEGVMPFGTKFLFNSSVIPTLEKSCVCGELTLFIKNESLNLAQIVTFILIKSGGVLTNSDFYQKVGNFSSVTASNVSNNLQVVISPGGLCRWIFRGV